MISMEQKLKIQITKSVERGKKTFQLPINNAGMTPNNVTQ